MRTLKQFGALAVAVFALSAIGVASASAAQFTASATGNIVGKALENQVFTTNGGTISCTGAASKGSLASTETEEWHLTTTFSSCTGYTFASVDIEEKMTLLYTASSQVHIKNTVTFRFTLFGTSICTTTFGPQTVTHVIWTNSGTNKVKMTSNVTGITYTSSGGACGASGSNGTFKGASEVEREGGGTVRFDP